MRQALIAHYRRVAGEDGKDYEDATLWAIDQADTDLRTMSRSELRQFTNQLRKEARPVVKDVKQSERFTHRGLMAAEAKRLKDEGYEVLGYRVVTQGDRVDEYWVKTNSWTTNNLRQPQENGFYVTYAIPRAL